MTIQSEPTMIGSAVVLFENDADVIGSILQLFDQHTAIEMGEQFDDRLPITIEASDSTELESVTRWITEIDGVQSVDVVFVSFES